MSTELEAGSRHLPARRPLVDDVYDAVLSLLMDQVIAPGSRASIDGIARMLNVSPTPVREALARLEADGLVVKRALKGYTAAPLLDIEGLRQLFEMRRLLEPAAARLATEHLDPATLAELEDSTRAMYRAATSPHEGEERYADYRAFADHDARFHRLIAEHSGNDLLSDALVRLRSHLHLYRLYFEHGIAQETSGEHEQILAALHAGDSAAAEAAMREHMERSFGRLDRSLRARETGE